MSALERQTVTARDLRLLRRVIDPDRPAGPQEDIAQSLLEDVAELIGCDEVALQVMDYPRRSDRVQSTCEDEADPELDELYWRDFWDCLACSYPQRTGDTRVARMSDFGSPRGEWLLVQGLCPEMTVPLPLPDPMYHGLLLWRYDGPDFGERDLLLMTLLRPHIAEMHTRQLRRQTGAPELTPRQWSILRMVASGCTNRQVGRALGLTERTVAKHLENIYHRLGVQSRTEAIAAAGAQAPLLRDP